MKNYKLCFSKLLLPIMMFLSAGQVSAQYSIANQQSEIKSVLYSDIAADGSGNVYVTGNMGAYADTVIFGSIMLTCIPGSSTGFIAKMDGTNTWTWAKKINLGTGGWASIYDVTADNNGNIYITGSYNGTVSFDNITLTNFPGEGSYPESEIFIAKLNSSGNFAWAVKDGDKTNDDAGNALALDASGNIYLAGYITRKKLNCANCYPANNLTDIYVAKYNGSGVKQWGKRFANSSNTSTGLSGGGGSDLMGNAIAIDASGNVYVTGQYYGSVSFGTGSGLTLNTSTREMFTAKFNNSGTTLWVKSAGGAYDDNGLSICLDNSGNVYSAGWIDGQGPGPLGNVVKYSSAGTLLWTINAIFHKQSAENVFIHPTGTIGIRTTYSISQVSASTGALQSIDSFVGGGYGAIKDIALTSNGFIFPASLVTTTTVFGNLTLSAASGSLHDNFIINYTSPAPKPTGIANISAGMAMQIFPNPVSDKLYICSNDATLIGAIAIYDQAGRKVIGQSITEKQAWIDMQLLPPGNYFLKTQQQHALIKIIKQ